MTVERVADLKAHLRAHASPLYFISWRDTPLVGLGLLIHEDFCGF